MRKISLVGLCLAWIIGCGSPTPPPTQKSKSAQVAANPQSKTKKKTTSTKKKPAPKKEADSEEPEPGPAELMPESDQSKPPVEEKPEPETAEATPEKAAPAEGGAAAKETASKPVLKVKLSDDWAKNVTVDDLLSELNYSSERMGQNLKKSGDFDKFLDSIKAEGHLTAVLAALITAHPDAGNWRGTAAEVQGHALELAEAAGAKGAKNYHTAQGAYKKMSELLKKGEGGAGGDAAEPDWAALGELKHVMKQMERDYKRIHGAVSDESAFKKSVEDIRHHAAILATLTEITPAFRASEADMLELASKMAAPVRSALDAIKSQDFDKAKTADTAMNKACQECHKVKRFEKKGEDLGF